MIINVEKIGDFMIPDEPEARRHDSEITVHGICGRYDPELAHKLGEWGDRCGQEYSYLWRKEPEDVRVVLDIGANIGAFTVWACRVWWPNVERVYMYEPNEEIALLAYANAGLVSEGRDIRVEVAAVTTDPNPTFHEHDQSGRSHTWGNRFERAGVDPPGWRPGRKVPAIHPRLLPAADAIKCDAEGVDYEIFEHYQHWPRIKVAMFEWHSHEHRIGMFRICTEAGLHLRKNDCGESEQGVACWVRP